MRTFRQFNSYRIAKHVKGFFEGNLYISGLGSFEFHNGQLLMPEDAGYEVRMSVSEVNREIKLFDTSLH